MKKLITVLFIISIIIAFYIYISSNSDYLYNLIDISALEVFLLLLLAICGIFIRGIINRLFYNDLGSVLSLTEATGLAAINTLGNLLPLSAGLLAKGVYLREKHGISVRKYFSATIALFLAFLSMNGFIGLLAFVLMYLFTQIPLPWWILVGFLLMSASLSLLFIPLTGLLKKLGRLREKIIQIHEGWTILSGNSKLLSSMFALQAVSLLAVSGRLFFVFRMMSQEVLLIQCLIFSAASILTRIVNIAPGGLGVREVIVAGLGSIMGFDFGVCVIAVGIDRLLTIVMCLIMSPLLYSGAKRNTSITSVGNG